MTPSHRATTEKAQLVSTNDPQYGTSFPASVPSRKTRFFLLGIAFVSILGTSASFSLSTSALQLPGPAATPPPHYTGPEQSARTDVIGYHGQATRTNTLSSAWASGFATAWTLPVQDDSFLPAQLIADGSTLYAASFGSGAEAVATVSAYDVSGTEPVAQWSTTGPLPSRMRAEAFPSSILTQDEILLSNIIVDRSTGQQSQAPWGVDLPMGVAGGVLVTCDTFSSCSGWSRDSGEWTTIWTTQTSPQRRAGISHTALTQPTTAVIGSGTDAAVVVPVDEAHYAPQVINPATGAVTTLGEAPSAAGPSVSRITLARDGVLVASKSETIAYNTGGEVVGTVGAGWELDRLPTSDREVPSVADLSSFLTQGGAPWTTGTVERPYPNDDHSYTMVAVSTSGESYRIKPGESFPEMPEYNTWHAAQVRASTEGNALYIQGVPSAQRRAFFFNMSRDMTYVLPQLDDATNVVWVFDDLLVGTSDGAVVAFTPASQ